MKNKYRIKKSKNLNVLKISKNNKSDDIFSEIL